MIQTMTANASTVIDIAVAIRAMDGWITALYCGARPAWGGVFSLSYPGLRKQATRHGGQKTRSKAIKSLPANRFG